MQTWIERFLARVEISVDGCWIWTGAHDRYGYFRDEEGRTTLAHRLAYEYFVGTIPDGLQIDHLCRNKLCVRPDHLEPVTARENSRRSSIYALRTHCGEGHELVETNVRMTRNGRRCRTCERDRNRRHYAKKQAKRKADTRASLIRHGVTPVM